MASHVNNEEYEELVAGVSVTAESTSLGSVVAGIVKVKPWALNVSQLRDVLRRELPALPPDFFFLTRQGWPVHEEQETEIRVSDVINDKSVITIRRRFNPPRVGVRNLGNEIIGFIFIDYNQNAVALRHALKEQLSHINQEVLLLDSNGWPVCPAQEKDLLLWDLISEGFITLRSSIAEHISLYSNSIDTADGHSKKRKSTDWSGSSHAPLEPLRNGFDFKEGDLPIILLSYVRAEASKHARDLKWQLTDKGYKVFLDVDEIQGGDDWQDKLNKAVKLCQVFIPLITPQYGLTLWTNREVKLADKLQKQIVPINFLDHWPPECLAIQFSSVHFVPWKTPVEIEQDVKEGQGSRSNDIRFWDAVYVKRVVESVAVCYQESQQFPSTQETDIYSQNLEEEDPVLVKKNKNQLKLPCSSNINDVEFDRPLDLKPLVVMSVHPNDKEFTSTIRSVLTDNGYDVWTSSDLQDVFDGGSQGGNYMSLSRLASPMTPVAPGFPDQGPIPLNHMSQESSNDSVGHGHMTTKRPSLQFTPSLDFGFPRGQTFSRSESLISLSPVTMDKLRIFRNRAIKAGVVIILLSEDYCRAKTSQKQVFYCETRKRMILICVDKFRLPAWITCLCGNDVIQYRDNPDFFEDLKQRVKVAVDSPDPNRNSAEIRLQSKVTQLEERLRNTYCIYVTGSTKFFNARTESICHAIGQELAACKFMSLATSGFYGVGDIVGRSFCEERELLGQKPAKLFNILPNQDAKDLSKISRQTNDGKFQKVPYGQTLFVGESVCERDRVVARFFRVCLLIEGGADAAHEAEQFVWNDKVVIPIMSTGGAASGEHGAPSRILDVPPGVSESDWKILSKRDETVEEIASAVKRILCSVKPKETSSSSEGVPKGSKRGSLRKKGVSGHQHTF